MNKYDDIINMPHHESTSRKRMSKENRAAQFAPFAALAGYEDAILETQRLTNERKEIDEGLKSLINEKLYKIKNELNLKHVIIITYFVPDNKKEGGEYKKVEGIIKKFIENENKIILESNEVIDINEIIDITGNDFDNY